MHSASYSRSVVDLFIVWSQNLFCLFLYRFIKRFEGLFLVKFLEIRYQHWPYRELVVCLTLLKRPKTESLCKLKIRVPWIPHSAVERKEKTKLLFSPAVFNYTNIIPPTWLLVVRRAPVVWIPQGRKLQQELKNEGTQLELTREKGVLIELIYRFSQG